MAAGEIDIDVFIEGMSEADAKRLLRGALIDVGRLTAAIKARHPLAMGKGDGAVDTAIIMIDTCRCR